jgi:hypothetical protein
MTIPISVSADFEARVILVRYRHVAEGARVQYDDPIAPGATAGIDADGRVVAIELLNTDAPTLAAASGYAHGHQLAFPLHLSHLLEAA